MFNYITSLLLISSIFFIILVSFDLEFSDISKLSFAQNSNFTNNTNISSSNINSTGKNQTGTTDVAATDWLTFSNDKFVLKYPNDWNVEKKLSKFHVLDFKLIKKNLFSFIGIDFSSVTNPEEFTNKIVLDGYEKLGMDASSSGYEVYEVLDKDLNKYTIDGNPSSSHIVKYKYENNGLEGKIMEIFSLIDKRLFILTYQSTVENFDKDLPVVEKIIDSIKIIR
jgi:hypothetical protein